MQSLFNLPTNSQRGVVIPPSWSVTRQGLMRNLMSVMQYNKDRSLMTKSSHLLVRLINTIRVNYQSPIERFCEHVEAQAINVSTHFRLINELSSTSNPENTFYGEGVKELILTHSQAFDIYDAYTNWELQAPVKVVLHPKTDMGIHVPTGVAYSDEEGLAVIAINIPLLMVMYRGYIHQQLAKLKEGQQPKPTACFVRSYVLTNMLPSHLDLAIFNRLMALATDRPIKPPIRTHATPLANWDKQVDQALLEIANRLQNVTMSLNDMLCNIPTVVSINASEIMTLPTAAPTRQYSWVEIVARLPVLVSMAILSPDKLRSHDKSEIIAILRNADESSVRNMIRAKIPSHAQEIILMLESLAMAIGQRSYSIKT
jgi:hypothetical protein